MEMNGIWTTKEEWRTHEFDEALCSFISTLFKGDFVDIGCGNGSYVRYLQVHKHKCTGYDGSPLSSYKIADFSVTQDIGKYDNVLCLEVGEHIPQDSEQIFIDNLCFASKKSIILSWGIPGQGGTGHVNCRENYYIIGEMQRRGFLIDPVTTEILRDEASLGWFKNTILVFRWSH